MEWYYAEGGNRFGPIAEDVFEQMIKDGRITAVTLVWHEGMPQWRPYWTIAPGQNPAAAQPGTAQAGTAAVQSPCSQCHRYFSTDDMIRYQNAWVCAECKPTFFQRLQEGGLAAARAVNRRYAGFWIRVAATLIDSVILWLVNTAIQLATFGIFAASPVDPDSPASSMIVVIISNLLQIAVDIFYATFFVGKFAATPGKMACGIKVIVSDGSRVSYWRAFGRYFAKMLSSLTLGIGFIMIAFDSKKRGLHDYICNTRVVRK
jgi:uncharacterized RDD family membrane protein YckC